MIGAIVDSIASSLGGGAAAPTADTEIADRVESELEDASDDDGDNKEDDEEEDPFPIDTTVGVIAPPATPQLPPRKTEWTKAEIGRPPRKFTVKEDTPKLDRQLMDAISNHPEGTCFRKSAFRNLITEIMQELETEVDSVKFLANATLHQAAEEYIEDLFRHVVESGKLPNQNVPLQPGMLTDLAKAMREANQKIYLNFGTQDVEMDEPEAPTTDAAATTATATEEPKKAKAGKTAKAAKAAKTGKDGADGEDGKAAKPAKVNKKPKEPKETTQTEADDKPKKKTTQKKRKAAADELDGAEVPAEAAPGEPSVPAANSDEKKPKKRKIGTGAKKVAADSAGGAATETVSAPPVPAEE